MIPAICTISASELALVKPDFTYEWTENNKEEFFDLLTNMGVDVKQEIIRQENILHRNRMNQIVQCDRWVCNERTDSEWINSGYASQEARDKAQGNKLIEDIYKRKGLAL